MKVIRNIKKMQSEAENLRLKKKKIGFVPTMGYLHNGHIRLIKEARKISDVVVVSIFVNPKQFGPTEDYERYPRNEKRDLWICKTENVDYVFIPSVKDMYPVGFQTYVEVEELEKTMCGVSRPGHFRGVATVVSKLFNIVKPHFAFFGLKDYQQALIVKRMIEDLNFDIKIKFVETVREPDGLALSSRNSYLSQDERKIARSIPESLVLAQNLVKQGVKEVPKIVSKIKEKLESAGAKVDYIEVVDPDTLERLKIVENGRKYLVAIACFVGKTRLIDNFFFDGKRLRNFPKIKNLQENEGFIKDVSAENGGKHHEDTSKVKNT